MKLNTLIKDPGWQQALDNEFRKDYFKELNQYLERSQNQDKRIYPPSSLIFNAFNLTPFKQVKVIILGQDPYHNLDQAMGLSFSVPAQTKLPPSLKNIYKELHQDVGFVIPNHGDLSTWSNQGVFLLNAILTVEHKKAGSHQKVGWQQFTNHVIQTLSLRKSGLVFLLWGNFARNKKGLIDSKKHLVLESAHPSPLARNAFFGHHHFSRTNAYLVANQKTPIDWQL